MNEPTYLELCVNALPPEKQAAARQAFHDLLEGAPDDSMLSRLLIVLEATAAYGRTIPTEMAAMIGQGLARLDERLKQLSRTASEDDERRLAQLRTLLEEQLPNMARALSVEKHTEAIESLRVVVERLVVCVHRMRHARLAVVAALMVLAAGVGVAATVAYFRADYDLGQRSRRHLERMLEHGVSTRLVNGPNGVLILSVDGPAVLHGTDWKRDPQGRVIGVEIFYP